MSNPIRRSTFTTACLAALILAFAFSPAARAANGTWLNTGNTSASWVNANNWLGGTVPGATTGTTNTDTATFSGALGTNAYGTAGTPILIDANRNLQNIIFDLATGAYTIGTTGGATLALTSGGAITMNLAVANTETINAPLVIWGGGGTYSFINNATNNASQLNIGGAISGGTAGATVLTLDGTNTGNNTISGVIANGTATTMALTKSGAGTWMLNGNNSYAGVTTINGGALTITGATGLGATTAGTTVADGACLQLQGGVSGAFTVGAEALTLNGSGISSGGALRNLRGDNTYAGLVTLGSAARINSDSGTLALSNAGTITGSGFDLTVGGAGNTTFTSIIGTGAGGLIKDGTGTLVLAGVNTYTGLTTISGGTVQITQATGLGTAANGTVVASGATLMIGNTMTLTEALTINGMGVNNGGALRFTAATPALTGLVTLGSAARINNEGSSLTMGGGITNGGFDLTLGGSAASTINSAVTGTGGLTEDGLGTWTLSGANTYTGITTLNAGYLALNVAETAGTSGPLGKSAASNPGSIVLNGGFLKYTTATNLTDYSGRFSTAANQAYNFYATSSIGNVNWASALTSSNGSLTMSAPGVGASLTLSGANTYTGTTTIAGTLILGAAETPGVSGPLGRGGSIVFNTGGILSQNAATNNTDYSGRFSTVAGQLYNILLAGNVTWATGLTSSGGSLTVGGGGALTLTGASTYTGVTNFGGSSGSFLNLGNGGATGSLSPSSTINLSNNGAFAINRSNAATQGIDFGTITGGAGLGRIVQAGTGTTTFNANNTYAGLTTVNAGTLRAGGASVANVSGAFGISAPVQMANVAGATLDLNNFNNQTGLLNGGGTTGGNVTLGTATLTIGGDNVNNVSGSNYDGAISGTGGLTKIGATLTQNLRGANTYTGLTTIAGGVLNVSGSLNGTTGTALTFGGVGGYTGGVGGYTINFNELANSSQGMGTVTFSSAGDATVQSTYGGSGTNTLTFSAMAARALGATANFFASSGTSTTNKIVISALTNNSFIDKGVFYNGTNYAWVDAAGFLRAINYGTDTGSATSAGTGSLASTAYQKITGAITAQSTVTNTTLNIANASSYTLASGATLVVQGILKSGGGSSTISGGNPIQTGTGSELVIRTDLATDDLTISSGIADMTGNSLTKSGAGTLTLSGLDTYTGATTVNAGTLKAGIANAFGSNSALTLANVTGTTLDLNNFTTQIGSLAGSGSLGGNVTLGTATLTAGGDNTSTAYAGVISGTGGFTKAGSGTQTFTGANTYTGITTINGGTLQLGNGGTTGSLSTSSAIVDNGNLTVNRSDSISQGGAFSTAAITGTGSLTKAGTGQLTLNAANTYTGTTTLASGTLTLAIAEIAGTSGPMGKSAASNPGSIVLSGGVLKFASGVNMTDYSGRFSTNANQQYNILMDGSSPVTWATALTSAGGSLNVLGGTLTLTSGASTYSGTTTLTGSGSITLNAAEIAGVSGPLGHGGSIVFAGGTLYNSALNNYDYSSRYSTNAGQLYNLQVISSSLTNASGLTSAGGSLIKNGSALYLTGTNTYSGTTSINQGLLEIGTGGTTGSLLGSGTITSTANGQFGVNRSDTVTQGVDFGRLIGTSGLQYQQDGSGTVTLNGVNNYTGATTVNNGRLNIATSTALGTGAFTIGNPTEGFAKFDNTSGASITLSNAFTINNYFTFVGTSDMTFNGAISMGSLRNQTIQAGTLTLGGVLGGGHAFQKYGAGTLVLSGANINTGTTLVVAGVLNIRNGSALGTTSAGTTVSSGAALQIQDGITVGAEALTLNGTGIGSTGALRNISGTNVWQGVVTLASAARINSDAGSLTFNTAASNITGTNQNLTLGGAGNGTIATTITTGTGNLTKDGSGTWTLSGANIYTGGTIVNGGTLDLGGGTASGSLASSLTLGGGTLAYTRTGSQTQTFTGTTINPGASAVTAVAGDILDLGAINRNVGGIVDVNTTGTIITSTANSNGILGGWATFGGNTWAVSAGSSAITGLASYTNDTWAAANNTTVTGSSSPGLGSTTNSLRFDAPGAYTLTLSGTNTITSGGILVTSAVVGNLSRITGGSLTAAPSKDLIVIQNNTGAGLTIDSIINNNTSTGLTKSGAGQLTLTAANTYTGSTRVNGGTLTVGIANSLGSLSAVSLSDTAGTTLNLQDFSTVIGSLAGGGKLGGNVILGNTGTNATLTLGGDNTTTEYAGIISGTHGITKTGSGIQTLSGNNTYTGTTTVNGGSLQLGSGGTSGSLSANSTIVLNNSSRFKINRSDSVTQGVDFGAITGGGYVDLLGTGTTTLVGTNTFAQHLIISAGNLNLTGAHNLDGSFTNLIITGAGLDNTSGGALTFANPISLTGSINFVGTSDLTFTGAVTMGNINLTVSAANLTLGGVISAGAINKSGAGTLILSGNNTNNYGTNAATVNAGVLNIRNGNALGSTLTGTLVASGAALQIQDGITVGAEALSLAGTGINNDGALRNMGGTNIYGGTVTLAAATRINSDSGSLALTAANSITGTQNLTLGGAGNGTVGGTITTGTGTLTKDGAGTWTLSGANTYTGTTTVTGGLIGLNVTENAGTSGPLGKPATLANSIVLQGGGLQFTSNNTYDYSGRLQLADSSTGTIDTNGQSVTFANAIGVGTLKTGLLTKAGTGTLTLAGNNTYTGLTTIVNGALVAGAAAPSGSAGALGNAASAVVLGDASSISTNLSPSLLTGGAFTVARNITVGASNAATSGVYTIGGNAASTSTFSGNATLNQGLTVSQVASGTVNLTGNITSGSSGTQTLTFNNAGSVAQSTGVIGGGTGTIAVTQSGAGTTTLSGINTYTGGTTVSAGELDLNSSGQSIAGNLTVSGGTAKLLQASQIASTKNLVVSSGTFDIQTFGQTLANVQLTGGNITGSGSGTLTSTNAYDMQAGSVSAILGGGVALNKTTSGTVTLSGANTYTGLTTVSAGELDLNASGQSIAGNLTVSGGTAKLLQASQIASSKNLVVSSGTFDIQTFGQTLANVQLTGGNINGSGSGTLTSTNAYDMQAGSVSAILGGGVALNKTTSGTVTLSGANTYTGLTTVSAGTLLVNGSTVSSSAFTVASGGTLGGSGTISGAVTVQNGGFLAPGSSPGVLTVGSLLLNTSSTVAFEINGTTGPGTDYDQVVVSASGGLTLDGAFTIHFGNNAALADTTDINLITYSGTLHGGFTSLASTGYSDYAGTWAHGTNEFTLVSSGGQTLKFSEVTGNLTVVPEPATWALLAFSLTVVTVLRRRRNS